MYIQGKDLKQGMAVRCVSSSAGICVGEDAAVTYLVTDATDRKTGAPMVVSLRTGATAYASELSVWNTGNGRVRE